MTKPTPRQAAYLHKLIEDIIEQEGAPPLDHDDVEELSREDASAFIVEMKSDLGYEREAKYAY